MILQHAAYGGDVSFTFMNFLKVSPTMGCQPVSFPEKFPVLRSWRCHFPLYLHKGGKSGGIPPTRLFSLYWEQCTRGLQGSWDRDKKGVWGLETGCSVGRTIGTML